MSICNEKFNNDKEDKHYNNCKKFKDHDHYTGKYRGAAHSICNLRYETQREIPVVLHNGSNYDFHIIIKELAKEFRTDVKCLGENTEKYVSFSIPLKVTNDEGKIIIYRLKFIDSSRFMNTSLSNLTDNLPEINTINCETCMEKNRIISECQYITHENNGLIYKCKKCNAKSYKLTTPLKEKFRNTYNFCNDNIDKFLLLLRKGVYPYKFEETMLPPHIYFDSELNIKENINNDYEHAQKVWNTFNIKHLGDYHDLYVQAETSQLADTYGNFRKVCLGIYHLDPAYFVSAPDLA